MPINFDLENLRQETGCENFFETGLWDARENVSSRQALNANFKNVFCIELRKDWVNLGREVFKEEIAKNRYHLIHDDSVNMQRHLEEWKDVLFEKTMFFLDAHVDNVNICDYQLKCPLFRELAAIKTLSRNDHIILIDDVRALIQPFPWNEESYGPIVFLEKIMEDIKKINPDYKFKRLNGYIENDVLMAYI